MVIFLVAELDDVIVSILDVFLQNILKPRVDSHGFLFLLFHWVFLIQVVVGIVLAQRFNKRFLCFFVFTGGRGGRQSRRWRW